MLYRVLYGIADSWLYQGLYTKRSPKIKNSHKLLLNTRRASEHFFLINRLDESKSNYYMLMKSTGNWLSEGTVLDSDIRPTHFMPTLNFIAKYEQR